MAWDGPSASERKLIYSPLLAGRESGPMAEAAGFGTILFVVINIFIPIPSTLFARWD